MKRILLNGVWNTLSNLVGLVLGIISSILIVRQLTPEEYGVFSYLIWLLGILGVLGTLAFPVSLTRIRSELLGAGRIEEAHALSVWVIMGLVGINLLLSIMLFTYAITAEGAQRAYLVIIALLLVPGALANVLRSYSWASQQYAGVAVIALLGSLAQFVIVVISFQKEWGVPGYFIGFAASILIQSILLFLLRINPVVKGGVAAWRRQPDKHTTHSYFNFAFQSTLVMLITTIVWERSEIFFLQRYSSISQVGYYNLAFTTFSMFLSMGWAFINGFYPALSNDFGAGRTRQLSNRMVQGIELSMLFSVPIGFGGMALMRYIIPMLYGTDMNASIPVAQVLYVGMIPAVLAGLLNICFTATNHIRVVWITGALMAAVNVLLNLYSVPRYGAFGAAISNTSSQLLYTVTMFILVTRIFSLTIPWRRIGLLLVLGSMTCFLLPLWVVGRLGANWLALVVAVLFAACGYLAVLIMLRYVYVTSEKTILRPGRWLY